jgi:caa(3)-type oxidase subunit IV
MSDHDPHFSSNKIFLTLFVLTAVEVGWSLVFHDSPAWLKWGGLLVFAFWKGILIYTYCMHMKFEGWIGKCLIAPTPILIAIVLFALMPDIAFNSRLDYPVGSQLDKDGRAPGQVVELGDPPLEETTGGEGH